MTPHQAQFTCLPFGTLNCLVCGGQKGSFGWGATFLVPVGEEESLPRPSIRGQTVLRAVLSVVSHCFILSDLISAMLGCISRYQWAFWPPLAVSHQGAHTGPEHFWGCVALAWLAAAGSKPPGFLSGVVKAPPSTRCEFIYFQRLPGTLQFQGQQCHSAMLVLTNRLCHGIAGIAALVQPVQVVVVTPCFHG